MRLLKNSPPKLNLREDRLVSVMQVLGDKTRFRMFKIMLSGKEMCVTDIADVLGISSPAVSQHFRIFELVGLVDRTRKGQKICYSLKTNDPLAQDIIQIT